MEVRCGTSGFSYPAWRGTFYPPEAKAGDFLALYAARLPAVEVNNTFYRMPGARLLAGWRAQVPVGFAFALKGPQRITHRKRLREAEEETAFFHASAAELGPALGPVLWQLPPNMKKDLPRLAAFLDLLPAGSRPAFEFRHESWLADDVHDVLHARGAALVAADDGERQAPVIATAPFGYLRLRAPDYSPEALRTWAGRILAQPWTEAWAFLKHEQCGPALALALQELVGGGAVSRSGAGGALPAP